MAGEVSEAVKKCCALLKTSGGDNEKFAALFMVTKLVKGKHATPAARVAIFEAIGFDFLRRLLLTDNVPIDCPPNIYKSLALNILTVFCVEDSLVSKPEILDLIPVFLQLIQTDDASDSDSLIAVREAFSCLKGVANVAPQALIQAGAVEVLSRIYSNSGFQSDDALDVLALLIVSSEVPLKFDAKLLNKIAVDFATEQDQRKFQLAKCLNAILSRSPKIEGDWSQSVYKGLSDILQSRLGAEQRDPALILTATMLDLFGFEWILLQDEVKGKQFFLLLTQLAAIEVRMQLEGVKFKDLKPKENLIGACFVILEKSLSTLDNVDLEQKERQSVYQALKGAFSAVVAVLGGSPPLAGKLQEDQFVFACVRVLMVWIAQEPTTMREQLNKLLPHILQLIFNNQTVLLRVSLPALCHLVVEDQTRNIVLQKQGDRILVEALEHYWTKVNYKRPPIPRSERLKALTQPKPELTPEILEEINDSRLAMISLCNVLMNLTVLEGKHVESSPVFSTQLLQFTLQNLPELKDTPDNLVLHGNLTVLGLLLLKQLPNKLKKNDFSICRFVQSTIRFLWNAYTVDESNPNELVVSLAYKEHWMELMELWFLGMQTLAAILQQLPWIGQFIVESGWAEGIVQLLKQVKVGALPANVKSAYEDFLCRLVDADADAVDALKKAEALRVCRNHRLMELGKKLFGD